MPILGSTAIIVENIKGKKDISLREFVLYCAGIDKKTEFIEETEYGIKCYEEGYEYARVGLLTAMNITDEELIEFAKEDYEKEITNYAKEINFSLKLAVKYGFMLAELERWEPKEKKYNGFKRRMIDELKKSIETDCKINDKVPKKLSIYEYRNRCIVDSWKDMESNKDKYEENIKKLKREKRYLKELYNSMPKE